MAEIQLKHVYKKYEDQVVAVRDFNLEIKDQEFVIFVGPSGCGKSTTLRMIAGLEEISDGKLLIDGKMMNQVQSCDRDIAMVFQNYALYPHMTVFENMAYSLRLKKSWGWKKYWIGNRESSLEGRNREWQWDAQLYEIPKSFLWMNHCLTWMQN